MNQTDRVIEFIRDHPRCGSWDITVGTRVVNTTGRISDARARGVDIVCETREDGVKGYRLIEAGQMALAL